MSGSHGGISARRHFRVTSGPLVMGVEHETCITIHETHLEGILSQKNLTGLAGGFNNSQDPTEGFRRAGTLGPLLAPYRCELKLILVELFRGHIWTAF